MKKLLFLSLFLGFGSLFLASCCCEKKAAETVVAPAPKKDYAAEGYVKATIIFYEIDACKYLVQLDPEPNGPDVLRRFEPTNLKDEFKKDQLAVWIKYAVKKGAMSTCQAGPVIDIADIQLRN